MGLAKASLWSAQKEAKKIEPWQPLALRFKAKAGGSGLAWCERLSGDREYGR
jgi:hypothetical protein